MNKDEVRCVVLGRANKSASWDLIIICSSMLSAWRWSASVEKQQHGLGDKSFQCLVVTEADYDANKINAIRPPKGTDLSIPEGVPDKEPEKVVLPKALPAAKPAAVEEEYDFTAHAACADLLGV